MGLFDNLFLDQNTAVTINDGIDHSKDIVTEIVPPTPTVDATTTTSTSSDKNLDGLFESDSAEEKAAQVTLNPEPPKDIALDIGHGTVQSSDPEVTFDIGGDISFDIGGDMSTGIQPSELTHAESTSQIEEITLNSEQIIPEGAPSFLSAEIAGAPVSLSDTSSLMSGGLPIEVASADNALFSLLNEETPTLEATSSEGALPESPSEMISPLPSDSLPDMFSGVLSPEVSITPLSPEVSNPPEKISPNTSSMSSYVSTVTSSISPLTALVGSPKLKEKLSQFINELESMEFSDQGSKDHKIQQIEMYKTRITEINTECSVRVRALQLEIEALEKDIENMDKEKTTIKNVIETFQKELKAGEVL